MIAASSITSKSRNGSSLSPHSCSLRANSAAGPLMVGSVS